jgi:nifR3 family TIM-barrel protein
MRFLFAARPEKTTPARQHITMPMLPWFKHLPCPLFLAPMAGFTGFAFRRLCKKFGADVLVSEFVQAEPLLRDVVRTWQTIDFDTGQRPMGVQIFGAIPERMAHAARLLAERLAPDFIDLNFGCPATNVVEQNAGASLLRDIPLLLRIAHEVVRAVPGHVVTAKIRLGWDEANLVGVEAARGLEQCGVRAIAVHGRTRVQGYAGTADWGSIARVASAVRLPIIGNGDIRDAAGAVQRFRESGVAGLMIGRAALGNPWLFREIKAVFRGETIPPPPDNAERWATLREYAEAMARQSDGTLRLGADARWMLARLHPLIRGLPGSRQARASLPSCRTIGQLLTFIEQHTG